MATSNSATAGITTLMQETIVAFGEDFSIVPMLADSWEISDDGMTYTFNLREGVKFHNGKEMTSDDVIASIDRFLEVTARASSFEIMESYEAPDDYTLVTKLSKPSAGWLGTLASPSSALVIMPREAVEGKGSGDLVVPDDILGTGPYKLVEIVPDQYALLERFEDYQSLPGERDGLGGGKIAYFDTIRMDFVPEAGARLAGLEVGDYDWISGPSQSDIGVINASPDMELVVIKPANGGYILFNHSEQQPFSSDVTFRQAVLAALDMESLGMAFTGGNRDLFDLNPCMWPEGTFWNFQDDFADAQYNQHDIEKAQQLLAEAGYNGEEIVIATYNDESWTRIMLALASQLGEAGIKTKVELYDWPGIFAKWAEETGWHISFTQNNTFQLLDPGAATVMWTCASTHPVSVHYCNPDMDAAFEALAAAPTLDEYKEALKPIQQLVYEDLPNIKTGDNHVLEAIRSEIKGYRGFGRGGTYRFYGVWRQE
jgi:peptide/nickel transport system substrate-binding protein